MDEKRERGIGAKEALMPAMIWLRLAHGATVAVRAEPMRGVYPLVILDPVETRSGSGEVTTA